MENRMEKEIEYEREPQEIPGGLVLHLPPGQTKSAEFKAWEYKVPSPRKVVFLGELELEWEKWGQVFHVSVEYVFLEVNVDDDLPPDATLLRVMVALERATSINFA